jgi:predicted phage-related endonuclease
MQIHNLIQGSPEWQAFRLEHNGASEAAAMMGLSPKIKRNELLHMKHTGTPKEFSDWVQEHILDYGHEVEALARPIVEEMIGEDLYPVTCSEGKESASCDGLTASKEIAFEHKQYNAKLAESVAAGILPEERMPQCQQVLMVTGAQKVIFVVSDGTPNNMVCMDVLPDQEWFKRIKAGWAQFDLDLAEYQHVEILPTAVAAPVMALPALSIRVNGSIALQSNLDVFGAKLRTFIDGIDRNPSDDQAFADAENAVKVLEKAQATLEAAESSALAQTASIDEMCRTVAMHIELARSTRLMLEKIVKARKETIRIEIQQGGKDKAAEHIAALNKRLGKPYMPRVEADFSGVMKGKKSISSLRDAVDTELARFKIEANAVADRIQLNLATLRELASEHAFLFADTAQIVLKANDDCAGLIKLRIAEHKAAEEKRLAAERARIAEEERIKAEAKAKTEHEAQMRAQAAEAAQAEAKRITDAANAEAERVRLQAAHDQALADARELSPSEQAKHEAEGAQRFAQHHPMLDKRMLNPAPAYQFPEKVRSGPPITTGALCALAGDGLSITAAFIQSQLHVSPAERPKDAKSGTYWAASDVPAIFAALARHFEQLATTESALAA